MFEFSGESTFRGNAQAVGDRIRSLCDENGGTVALQDVVVEARKDDSPLHRYFEWRDHVAAKEYRLIQAKQLICSVMVVTSAEASPVRAFAVSADTNGIPMCQSAQPCPQLVLTAAREAIVQQAFRELSGWCKRYRHLPEVAEIVRLAESHKAISSPKKQRSLKLA